MGGKDSHQEDSELLLRERKSVEPKYNSETLAEIVEAAKTLKGNKASGESEIDDWKLSGMLYVGNNNFPGQSNVDDTGNTLSYGATILGEKQIDKGNEVNTRNFSLGFSESLLQNGENAGFANSETRLDPRDSLEVSTVNFVLNEPVSKNTYIALGLEGGVTDRGFSEELQNSFHSDNNMFVVNDISSDKLHPVAAAKLGYGYTTTIFEADNFDLRTRLETGVTWATNNITTQSEGFAGYIDSKIAAQLKGCELIGGAYVNTHGDYKLSAGAEFPITESVSASAVYAHQNNGTLENVGVDGNGQGTVEVGVKCRF